MRLIKRTAICDRRHGRYQLQRRYTNLLSHGNRSNGNWRPILKPAQHYSALARKVNTSLLAKSEGADIFVKFRRANSYGDLDGPDVARLRQNVGHRQQAERLVVANAVARHVHRAIFAIENFFGTDEVLIKRGSQCNQLKRRAGFVNCADRPIHPRFALYVVRRVRRSEEHTSELQSHSDLVCRLLLEKKNTNVQWTTSTSSICRSRRCSITNSPTSRYRRTISSTCYG